MLPEDQIKGMQDGSTATEEAVQIDLSERVQVQDSEADSNIPTRPPERGIYPFQWALNQDKGGQELPDGTVLPKGIVASVDKNRKQFVTVHLIGTLADESSDFNGRKVNCNINSIVFTGKPTSDVHSFLAKLGQPIGNDVSLGELINHIEAVVSENPIGKAELDWKFTYKNGEGKYIDQVTHMQQFPPIRDANQRITGYNNVIKSAGDGEPGYAQAYIAKHVS